MQKVRVTRFECFHVSASWKSKKQSFFYLELARDGTKEELAKRKTLSNLLTKEKRQESRVYHQLVEGTGYIWRVEASIIAKYADRLELPCTIEEELARFWAEGIKQPAEPIKIEKVSIHDIEKPHIISLRLEASNETLRRALDQYLEDNWQSKEDWFATETYGANISLSLGMLKVFESWFSFEKPLNELLSEAAYEAQKIFNERSELNRKHKEKEQEREQQRKREQERFDKAYNDFMRDFFRNSRREYNYRSYSYSYSDRAQRGTNTPTPHEALKLFGLESSATLQDVKKRYRTLAKQHHPDTGGDEEMFKKINAANKVLIEHFS